MVVVAGLLSAESTVMAEECTRVTAEGLVGSCCGVKREEGWWWRKRRRRKGCWFKEVSRTKCQTLAEEQEEN